MQRFNALILMLVSTFAFAAGATCRATDPNGPFANFCRTMDDSEQRCTSFPNQCSWGSGRHAAEFVPFSATDPAWLSNLAFGPSVPQDDPANHITLSSTSYDQGGQPTRYSGGEKITVHFMDSQGKASQTAFIDSIRLLGFSKSGTGAVMVRSVSAKPAQDEHSFDALSVFTAVDPTNKAQGKDGHVLLGAGDQVYLQLPQVLELSDLNFVFESFGSNDASIDVQFIWHGTNPKTTQRITRRIINPPVSHSGGGGWSGGGSSSSNSCISSIQCRGDEHCMNGQCIEVSRQRCSQSGIFTCTAGESCCNGRCESGSCH